MCSSQTLTLIQIFARQNFYRLFIPEWRRGSGNFNLKVRNFWKGKYVGEIFPLRLRNCTSCHVIDSATYLVHLQSFSSSRSPPPLSLSLCLSPQRGTQCSDVLFTRINEKTSEFWVLSDFLVSSNYHLSTKKAGQIIFTLIAWSFCEMKWSSSFVTSLKISRGSSSAWTSYENPWKVSKNSDFCP